MRTTSTLLSLLSLAALSGCYSTHDRGGGGIVLTDSGTSPRDGGAPVRRDASIHPPPLDAGGPIDCRFEVVEPWTGGTACSEGANACIRGCGGGAEGCFEECIAAEPACQRCFYQTVIACSNERGCLDEWRTFACCTEREGCGGLSGYERLGCAAACPAEIDEYSICLNDSADTCFFDATFVCNLSLAD